MQRRPPRDVVRLAWLGLKMDGKHAPGPRIGPGLPIIEEDDRAPHFGAGSPIAGLTKGIFGMNSAPALKSSEFGSRPAPDAKGDLKTLPLAEVEKKLGSSPDGLTQDEAQKRLTKYGPNEIVEKKVNPLLKFLSYFWGPIPWMIEIAVILSGVVRHWPDFFIILVLLVANAVVGFWEERQAGNAIAALKAKPWRSMPV